jgi:inosose dehydratase
MSSLDDIRLGTAPDSWGVWFADDPRQVPWGRFLDEVAEAGYEWIELGPYGYLPTDPEQLRDELGSRSLRLSGGTASASLHRGPAALANAVEECRRVSLLVTALGASHLILLPEMYSDLDGGWTGPTTLTNEEWDALTDGTSQLARLLHEEFEVALDVHPHADTHVDTPAHVVRLLEGTDPDFVNICLDTGHVAYCGGDVSALLRRFPERLGYVHLKQIDPQVRQQVDRSGLTFAQACALGVMIEPPLGLPEMEPLLDELGALGVPLFAIVEQDMYPCPPDAPLPIAKRTYEYLRGCGLR